VELLELAEQLGDHDPAGTRRRADLECPRKLVATFEPDLGDDLLLECQQPLCTAVETHSRLGRLDATPGPVEELRPEPLLERPHLKAHCGLGDAEPVGRLREAATLDDRAECGELTRVHKRMLCTRVAGPVTATLRDYDRPVAARLEDTLVSGYSRLAAEAPRRRIDVELRLLDVFFAALFGILLLPAAAAIAVAILVGDGRSVLYRGQRVGRHGHFFTIYKFRTLSRDAETRLGPYLGEELVRRTETEYTRIGRWLKASQLDEIPQLWNVLRGDMSFVGPRPIRPRFFAELAQELGAYWQRLVVRPGLTGFAQVRRGYETSRAEKLAHDLEWIADRSVRLYLRTLFATGWRVLRQTAGRR
jgi:lipopolysaccharide/colanic/teichoic acid biosynthesis glycosyltransferase